MYSINITQQKNSLKSLSIQIAKKMALYKPLKLIQKQYRINQRNKYYTKLINLYSNPYEKPKEAFISYERHKIQNEIEKNRLLFKNDLLTLLTSYLACTGYRADMGLDSTTLAAKYQHHLQQTYPDVNFKPLVDFIAYVCRTFCNEDLTQALSLHGQICANKEQLKRVLIDHFMNVILTEAHIPHFYDYDFIDDIMPILFSRYVSPEMKQYDMAYPFFRLLIGLLDTEERDTHELPHRLKKYLGKNHPYVPPRGDVRDTLSKCLPKDIVNEFIALRAEDNMDRFLEINYLYSKHQKSHFGEWDFRDLSLLRQYETNHHALLRAIIKLKLDQKLTKDDKVLIIGPRHLDELNFFRRYLKLPNTVGLDLVASVGNWIQQGDMHHMPFEDNTFKLIFISQTLSYSYNTRKVINEMGRVLKMPGFVFIIDSGVRKYGPTALARTDLGTVDSLIRSFYQFDFSVLEQDSGKSLDLESYEFEPCVAIRINKILEKE